MELVSSDACSPVWVDLRDVFVVALWHKHMCLALVHGVEAHVGEEVGLREAMVDQSLIYRGTCRAGTQRGKGTAGERL